MHNRVDDGGNSSIQIGIGKHHLRAFATEFQRDRAVTGRSHLLDQRADAGTARKTNVVDARMPRQCVAHLMAVTRDDVDGSCRKANIGSQLRHPQQRQAGIFTGLDDARIASGQRAAHAAAKNLHWIVPRNNMARHAMRLAPGHGAEPVLVRNRVAVQLVARTGVKLEVAGQCSSIRLRLFDGLAAVALLDQGQFIGMFSHLVGQFHQEPTPLKRRGVLPHHVKAVARGGHCAMDVSCVAALDLVKYLTVRRVDDRYGFA